LPGIRRGEDLVRFLGPAAVVERPSAQKLGAAGFSAAQGAAFQKGSRLALISRIDLFPGCAQRRAEKKLPPPPDLLLRVGDAEPVGTIFRAATAGKSHAIFLMLIKSGSIGLIVF